VTGLVVLRCSVPDADVIQTLTVFVVRLLFSSRPTIEVIRSFLPEDAWLEFPYRERFDTFYKCHVDIFHPVRDDETEFHPLTGGKMYRPSSLSCHFFYES
jgi:hypothetical protein